MTIQNEYARAEALIGLGPYLSESLLSEALAATRMIEKESVRAQALRGLALHLPDTLRTIALQEALTAIQAIQNEDSRANTLLGLAPHLPESLLAELASYLPEALLPEALATARAIENVEYRAKSLVGLLPRFVELSHPAILSLWQELLEAWNRRSRQALLSDLQVLTPVIAKLGGDGAIVELYHAIQDVGRWWP